MAWRCRATISVTGPMPRRRSDILNQVDPQPGPARTAALRELLRPLLVVAVRACRDARMAAAISAEAQRRLALAKADGGDWIMPLTERATDLSRHAAELLVAAIHSQRGSRRRRTCCQPGGIGSVLDAVRSMRGGGSAVHRGQACGSRVRHRVGQHNVDPLRDPGKRTGRAHEKGQGRPK